ncbi:hypothetical protein Anapl_09665 [Anas platyrhynchos]|uniref:Uncharacterized protein n=1 Tax=Anas platyrhynchos TaxID=8839 RepID=R0JFX0_ANAPL|nr:hypothetical protein Anapl_09665 [Anas platyrhynchos]
MFLWLKLLAFGVALLCQDAFVKAVVSVPPRLLALGVKTAAHWGGCSNDTQDSCAKRQCGKVSCAGQGLLACFLLFQVKQLGALSARILEPSCEQCQHILSIALQIANGIRSFSVLLCCCFAVLPQMFFDLFPQCQCLLSFINASVLNCAGSTELKDFSTSSTPAVWCSSLEYEMWLRFGERCEIASHGSCIALTLQAEGIFTARSVVFLGCAEQKEQPVITD